MVSYQLNISMRQIKRGDCIREYDAGSIRSLDRQPPGGLLRNEQQISAQMLRIG